ncbi:MULTISPECIES: hypothetical protein [Burkholderia]|uniref:hypothetical protein n=1 Tax=Burkholderia TaxID=32008 RepID=UPI000556B762|nr:MULTISPECIES: hypothetical protein [Burkholderia]TCT26549.1 hypothetical protein EC918_12212 [Burkholderia vietnamiensis]GBH24409.1 hypothetical protein BvRS1_14580 [Burkholderia vietnamiensis]SCZ46689.1 hypothetical protein SAMN02787148_13612 [Burkholderia vietnamiensis]SFY39903.1 hypothetical protein SAMN02787160_13611 [Burkholderia vietnamiensis]
MSGILEGLLWVKLLEGNSHEGPDSNAPGKGAGFPFLILVVPWLIIGLSAATLPALLCWQFRNRSWTALTLTILTVVAVFAVLMPYRHYSWWETTLLLEVCSSLLGMIIYMHTLVCSRLNKVITNGASAVLSAGTWIVFAILIAGAYLLFWGLVSSMLSMTPMHRIVSLLQGAFDFRLHFLTEWDLYGYFRLLVALSPTAMVATALQAFFRRRKSEGNGALPWYFKVAAIPSATCTVLWGALLLRNALIY